MEIVNERGLSEKEFLEQYRPGDYERPSVTVDILIFTINQEEKEPQLELLLIRRKDHPFLGCWALPGGFVGTGESLDETAARELAEETGLRGIYMEQLYTFGEVARDPRMRVISTSYIALTPKERLEPLAGDDAADAAWFRLETKAMLEYDNVSTNTLVLKNRERNLSIGYHIKNEYRKNGNILEKDTVVERMPFSESRLAFDHGSIINLALSRLRNKVEYTQIAFNLVPERFTLPELQRIYEAILGRKLQKAAFRRKVASLVEPTGEEKVVEGVIRNARYYRLKKVEEVEK